MNELFTMQDIEDKKFGFQFAFKGKNYVVWHWLSSPTQAYQICLSEIVSTGGGYTNGDVKVAAGSSEAYVNNAGGAQEAFDVFISRANIFLAEQLGDDEMEDAGFPEIGTDLEKFNWLVKFGLGLVNGEIVRK